MNCAIFSLLTLWATQNSADENESLIMQLVRTGEQTVVRTKLTRRQRAPLCARNFCRDAVPKVLRRPVVVGDYLYYEAELDEAVSLKERVRVDVEQILKSRRAYSVLVLLGFERESP